MILSNASLFHVLYNDMHTVEVSISAHETMSDMCFKSNNEYEDQPRTISVLQCTAEFRAGIAKQYIFYTQKKNNCQYEL